MNRISKEYIQEMSFGKICAQINYAGEDLHILLTGGSRPHIGCTVLALPRTSLAGNGLGSATSSVLNVTGHKDEQLCRYLAEQAASFGKMTVVCSGGFHEDDITAAQIQEVQEAVRILTENIKEDL